MFDNKTLLITGGTGSFGIAVLNRFRATDMGGFYRVSRDKPAAETKGAIAEFHSNNAVQLTVEQVKEKLLTLPYIQAELGAWIEQ